jgi:tetratricopeptide (TPR) repeat protein
MKIKLWHILAFVAVVILVAVILRPGKLRTGWMYTESGRPGEAVAKFMELYEKDPQNNRALALLARSLEENGQTAEAEKRYEQLIKLKPKDRYFQDLVRFYAWSEQPIKLKGAFSRWRKFRLENNISFGNEEGKKMLNELYGYDLLYQDYEEAIEILKQLREIEKSRRKEIDTDLITLYELTGNANATLDQIQEVLKHDPENEYALGKLVELAPIVGKTGLAEKILSDNIERNPKNASSWKRLIVFQTDNDKLDEATATFKKWLEANPNNKELQREYLDWLLATSQDHRAKSYLLSIDRSGEYADYYQRTLEDLYEWTGDNEAMFGIYLERFQADPRNRHNNKQLLDTMYGLERYDVGEEVLKKLVEIYPNDAEYAIMLDDVLTMQNKERESLKMLERAAQETHDPKLMKRLGQRYMWSSDVPSEPREAAKASEVSKRKTMPFEYGRWIDRMPTRVPLRGR